MAAVVIPIVVAVGWPLGDGEMVCEGRAVIPVREADMEARVAVSTCNEVNKISDSSKDDVSTTLTVGDALTESDGVTILVVLAITTAGLEVAAKEELGNWDV